MQIKELKEFMIFKRKPKITFKRATTDDVNEYLSIEKSTIGLKMYSRILDKDEALEEINNNQVYFIIKNNKIIGSCEYQIRGVDEVYLSGLVILPEFQSQGIAHQATEFRLNKLKNVKRIWLVTHPHNSKIIKMYLSYGFIIESWKDNYFGDGEPRIVLVKQK